MGSVIVVSNLQMSETDAFGHVVGWKPMESIKYMCKLLSLPSVNPQQTY